MSISIPFSGGCACRAIRYECSALPLLMFQCHCRDCQRAVGAAFAPNVWFESANLLFSEEPKGYVTKSEMGNTIYHDFCPGCGSPIGMRTDGFPELRGIRAASLDEPSWLSPDANIWTRNAYPWEHLNPDLRDFKDQPPIEYTLGLIEEAKRKR